MASSSSSTGGIGLVGVLTVIFVSAKIFEWDPIAQWSWWWVLSPLWISTIIGLSIFAVAFGLYAWLDR